ncbi:MAG TPA: glutamate synthase, partial [Desulfobacteraceae bacterium]|nr:glutamate synthase [Desulfobacteraceae bacterium]
MSEESSKTITIHGRDAAGHRLTSKIFEEQVRTAAAAADHLLLESFGQHNIGLRLGNPQAPLTIEASGPVGQRFGCMGQPGATLICKGSASDDVGYLNIGADIIIR